MIDLDLIKVDLACPLCGFFNPATMKQIRLEDVVICGGCKANIRLVDHMGEVAAGRRKLRAVVDEVTRAFGKSFRIRGGS
jgi:hypothetical protein